MEMPGNPRSIAHAIFVTDEEELGFLVVGFLTFVCCMACVDTAPLQSRVALRLGVGVEKVVTHDITTR